MEAEELEELSGLISDKLAKEFHSCCALDCDEQSSVKELLRTKKNAVRVFVYIFGALMVYALKDVYSFVASHLSFR